eukprot:NODE_1_length_95616_cov_0.657642.p38 type:complete len:281 gc:universal NODE_1_length_95616_cov_0.657642:53104-52262(-)
MTVVRNQPSSILLIEDKENIPFKSLSNCSFARPVVSRICPCSCPHAANFYYLLFDIQHQMILTESNNIHLFQECEDRLFYPWFKKMALCQLERSTVWRAWFIYLRSHKSFEINDTFLATCTWIAIKFDEDHMPSFSNILKLFNTNPNDIHVLERRILSSMGYRMNLFTPNEWLTLYLRMAVLRTPSLFDNKNPTNISKFFEIRKGMDPYHVHYLPDMDTLSRAFFLLDILSLHPNTRRIPFSKTAAGIFMYMFNDGNCSLCRRLREEDYWISSSDIRGHY